MGSTSAQLLGCLPEEIFFTSGGTEANNLAILGLADRHCLSHVVTSAIEHPAVARPCALLEKRGVKVTRLPVDHAGVVEVEGARQILSTPPRPGRADRPEQQLLTVMLANNETGSLQPVPELAALAKERGAVVHTDAAQAVGKVPVAVDTLGVDLLSVAGHKLYAPKGVGALYVRQGTPLGPVLLGAGHERGLRPGTENVASIVGLGVACRVASETLESESRRLQALRDLLWELLRDGVPGIRLNGHPIARLPNTLNVSFPHTVASRLLEKVPGLAASTGSACHEGEERPSSVLLAMGLTPAEALGAVRLSLGRGTTRAQVEQAAALLIAAWRD